MAFSTTPPAPRDTALWAPHVFAALAVACSILVVHPYRFGVEDQSITIPFLRSLIDPDLYPADYLIPQRDWYYTYFWMALASGLKVFGASLEWTFHSLYVVALFFTFLAVYRIAERVSGESVVGALAVVLVLYPQRSLASIWTHDELLLTRQLVQPLVLWSFHGYLASRYRSAATLLAVTGLLHPLSALYAAVALAAAAVAQRKEIGTVKLGQCLGILTAGAAPVLVWKLTDSLSGRSPTGFDAAWAAEVRLRSYVHVFPFSWNGILLAKALMVLGIVALALRAAARRGWVGAEERRTFLAWTAGVAALCLAGIVFAEVVLLPTVVQLQLLRSYKLVYLFAAVLLAVHLHGTARAPRSTLELLVAAVLLCAFSYGALWWKAQLVGVAVALVLLAAQPRLFPGLSRRAFGLGAFAAVPLVTLAMGEPRLDLTAGPTPEWMAVQEWARAETHPSAIFVVDPESRGFRVFSERTSYGDWKDGTLGFFDPAFGREWMRRMRVLGFASAETELGLDVEGLFPPLTLDMVTSVADEDWTTGRDLYVVRPARDPALPLPTVYANDGWVVQQLPR